MPRRLLSGEHLVSEEPIHEHLASEEPLHEHLVLAILDLDIIDLLLECDTMQHCSALSPIRQALVEVQTWAP